MSYDTIEAITGMLKHVYLILLSTFFLGFLAGVLLFLNTASREGGGSVDDASEGFSIAVYAYGGCERLGCPLYRITQTGEYIYIPGGMEDDDVRRTGTIPFSERRALAQQLAKTDLVELSASAFEGTCPAYVDGVAYRYDITYKGTQFTFDSCAEATEEVLLFHMLNGYFETLDRSYEAG